MPSQTEIINHLNKYLAADTFDDSSVNGLQIEGPTAINRIIMGVTAGLELFQKAQAEKADLIIVHHGHFWAHNNPSLTGFAKTRIRYLLDNNIGLYAAHLPLDAHPEIGNNAQLLKLIDATIKGDFFHAKGRPVSFWGSIPRGQHLTEIENTLNRALPTICRTLSFGPAIVQSVAVGTGGGAYSCINEAIQLGVDLLITGDTAEIYHLAKDAKLNVIFAGHHATETLGVKALGTHLHQKFQIPVGFIDIPTEL